MTHKQFLVTESNLVVPSTKFASMCKVVRQNLEAWWGFHFLVVLVSSFLFVLSGIL